MKGRALRDRILVTKTQSVTKYKDVTRTIVEKVPYQVDEEVVDFADGVRVELSMTEAERNLFRELLGYDVTIPQIIAKRHTDDSEKVEAQVEELMNDLRKAISVG